MAARHLGKPVKLVVSRRQMFTAIGHRAPTVQRVRLGATRDGKLVAMSHTGTGHTARYAEFVEPVALMTRMMYACPAVATSHRVVPLDVHVPTYMRAPGESTGSVALEVAMDELAFALGIAPVEVGL